MRAAWSVRSRQVGGTRPRAPDTMEGVEKKKPLSRKKQLAELKKARKARKIEAGQTAGNCDPDYEPGQEVEEARHAEGELAEMEVEQPGEAAGRERNKQR